MTPMFRDSWNYSVRNWQCLVMCCAKRESSHSFEPSWLLPADVLILCYVTDQSPSGATPLCFHVNQVVNHITSIAPALRESGELLFLRVNLHSRLFDGCNGPCWCMLQKWSQCDSMQTQKSALTLGYIGYDIRQPTVTHFILSLTRFAFEWQARRQPSL